jgi:hypothetical protein
MVLDTVLDTIAVPVGHFRPLAKLFLPISSAPSVQKYRKQ